MRAAKIKVKEDFKKISVVIKDVSYKNLIDNDIELLIKQIHKVSYSICKWKIFISEEYNDYSIDEIFSDFIEILYIIPIKDTKILMFLTRNIIDNFRRLVKNTFGVMSNDFDNFIIDMKNKSQIKEFKESVDTISRVYKESSKYIHSTCKNKCNLTDGLKNYVLKNNIKIKKCTNDILELGKSINFIFILIYTQIYVEKFGMLNREIVLNALDNTRAKKIKELLH
ncbi:hypothetical protein [Clostridium cagae]|uniref:hypothetical protein n=1 Tax=Clostridium cagae TaxID=2080751 RepID=UPI000CF628E6|nr:hypothetical protein [Clostridium cagae]